MAAARQEMRLGANPDTRAATAPEADGLATLAKLAASSFEGVERELRVEIDHSQAQAQRYQIAFDAIAQGVCYFDAEKRLILSNRRYAEIYRLAPEQVRPGATLREIVELRVAAGTYAAATADDYLSFCAANNAAKQELAWTAELQDGRTVQMRHQPISGGGWIGTHEDISELKTVRAAANERLSVQALIDRLPDNLWVKDVSSRFVIANQATAKYVGVARPADLIGKTDFELLPIELATKFFADERQIVRSGQPMIDIEEYAFDRSGGKTWVLTTKVPLRNDSDEIFGVAGISRDITERKLADALRDGQAQILEMITMSAPLEDVLERLVRLTESQFTGIIGSIMLLDEGGTRLRHGAAPSLPDAYAKAIDGTPIGPNAGSSGAAAYR